MLLHFKIISTNSKYNIQKLQENSKAQKISYRSYTKKQNKNIKQKNNF